MKDATLYEKTIVQLDNDRAPDAIKNIGKTVIDTPTAEEQLAFSKALAPVQQQREARIGKEMITAITAGAK